MTSNYNNAISVSSFFPLPHYHIKLERSMKKVKTRYCGLSENRNEQESHVIMKE